MLPGCCEILSRYLGQGRGVGWGGVKNLCHGVRARNEADVIRFILFFVFTSWSKRNSKIRNAPVFSAFSFRKIGESYHQKKRPDFLPSR